MPFGQNDGGSKVTKRWKVVRPAESDPMIAYALQRIYRDYGHQCVVNRKDMEKFGGNPSVGTSIVTVQSWGVDEVYQTSNVTLKVSSSSTSDVGNVVTVELLTIDSSDEFTFQSVDVTLNGQSKVDLPVAAARWTRAYTRGSALVGDVYFYRDGTITAGVPNDLTTVHLHIPAGFNQSEKASTTIARTNYFLMFDYWADAVKKSGVVCAAYLEIRWKGEDWHVFPRRGFSSDDGLYYIYKSPRIIPPNSDIRIRAASSAAGTDITAGFNGLFADIHKGLV